MQCSDNTVSTSTVCFVWHRCDILLHSTNYRAQNFSLAVESRAQFGFPVLDPHKSTDQQHEHKYPTSTAFTIMFVLDPSTMKRKDVPQPIGTYSSRNQTVKMPDGSRFDVGTKEGSDGFLQDLKLRIKCFSISPHVEQIQEIRRKGTALTSQDKSRIVNLESFLVYLAKNVDPKQFMDKIKTSDIKCWLQYIIEEIQRLTVTPNWIETGDLKSPDDIALLDQCLFLFCHEVPLALAFESEFFSVLAGLVKARKGNGRSLPSKLMCKAITKIVSEAFDTCLTKQWSTDKAFQKLAESGMLEEFIRCVTVPQSMSQSEEGKITMMMQLLSCCADVLERKFKRGKSCDVLGAILNGNDGSRKKRPKIFDYLRLIEIEAKALKNEALKKCHHCGKPDKSKALLKKCSRCHAAFYCSEVCQKAHWKRHKKVCAPVKKTSMKAEDFMKMYMGDNDISVSRRGIEIGMMMAESGRSDTDLLLELDFVPNTDDAITAMKDLPYVKTEPIRDYFEEATQPVWMAELKDKDPEHYKSVVSFLLDRGNDSGMKVLIRSPSGEGLTSDSRNF
mmetsp:Transcript_40237/g.97142  ORF Transcript_40237/g.97142 Transcript_40237/m.97142 type:complete len:560 (+) Transcript_40237:944-2623(+)